MPTQEDNLTCSYNIIAEWAGPRTKLGVTVDQLAALQQIIYRALEARENFARVDEREKAAKVADDFAERLNTARVRQGLKGVAVNTYEGVSKSIAVAIRALTQQDE